MVAVGSGHSHHDVGKLASLVVDTMSAKNLIRALEQRLEALLDGMAGRVFQGPLHPVELAGRIIRRADLSATDTDIGPLVANRFVVVASPVDLVEDVHWSRVQVELARLVEEAAADRGWRLEGPAEVVLRADPELHAGDLRIEASVERGPRDAWARLVGDETLAVCLNRSVVGRDDSADINIPDPYVSRRHALIWREAGSVLLRDLGSANGTTVDGTRVGSQPARVESGSVIRFGRLAFRFER